jgi:hypothetical protein
VKIARSDPYMGRKVYFHKFPKRKFLKIYAFTFRTPSTNGTWRWRAGIFINFALWEKFVKISAIPQGIAEIFRNLNFQFNEISVVKIYEIGCANFKNASTKFRSDPR